MKKLSLLITITIYTLLSYAQTTPIKMVEKLKINSSKSKIKWSGEYAFYFGGHEGYIDFKEGYFLKNMIVITGGKFIIDMTTIENTDIKNEEAKVGLVEHLKNEDFFDVNKYPVALLVITRVTYESENQIKIHADLSIKDVTKPINLNAEVDYKKETLSAKFKIDRTLWNITYNSKEVEGKLKDGLISDAISFEVKLSL